VSPCGPREARRRDRVAPRRGGAGRRPIAARGGPARGGDRGTGRPRPRQGPVRRPLRPRCTGPRPTRAAAYQPSRAARCPAAPGGVAALLVPAKLATSGYAAALRQRLATETRIERVAPLAGGARAFDAAVYPMALVAARADPGSSHQTATALGPASRAPNVA